MEDSISHNLNNLSLSNNNATYVLRWKSALSRVFTLSTLERCMKRFDYDLNILSMRIRDWQNVREGDVLYVIHEAEGATGIVLRGIIMHGPHTYKDWCIEEHADRLIDIHVNQIMHPDKAILPDTRHFEERWNNDEWKGCKYLTLIDKQTAEELDNLFNSYLKKNKEQFAVNKNNGVAITDFEIE